jgi:hypothetical protein
MRAGAVAAAGSALLLLAACTSTGPSAPPSTSVRTVTQTAVQTIPAPPISAPPVSAPPTTPLSSGPTTAASGTCPYVTETFANDSVGQRLGRQEVLRSDGAIVGCRFYAIQGTALATSENLPGANQPDIEITTATYATTTVAHNAVVRLAEAGSNIQSVSIPDVFTACFENTFDPTDGDKDWMCAFSAATRVVVVKLAEADTSGADNVIKVTRAVATKFGQ